MTNVALITGVTGQDGSYLAESLLAKGYEVHGIKRRASSFNTARLDHIPLAPPFYLHYGDVTDTTNLIRLLNEIQPTEVYNLAAQSHVQVSFDTPEYTAQSDALGPVRLLEGIRLLGLDARFYQAATSEMYGNVPTPMSEDTPFHPRSPYGAAKLYGYWITRNYREAYGMHASSGILFNHESPRRGETFVTRKITQACAASLRNPQPPLRLGNLDAKRDWGHARDYAEAMWLMLQQPSPDDYVIATGEAHSVREFAELAFDIVGTTIEWRGTGVDEIGYRAGTDEKVVCVDPHYFRPAEIDVLLGDPTKAREKLGWTPTVTFFKLVKEMVMSDIDEGW